ncbi:flap endonuclease-1 [Candidatus Woesearchaeota archaeon]|nr:flap endonuclease-1 [Candidatus Woesearchaeota archaeon]
MGLNVKDIIPSKEISLDDLSNKRLAVDTYNLLYQFLTTIRQPDGSPLLDSKGRITSHLNGLFSRTMNLLQKGIRLAFVFDGAPPALKAQERERRSRLKKEAMQEYEIAKECHDISAMKKHAGRTARLEPEMVEEAKELIRAMGMPVVQAPSEGEAQAAYMAKKGDVYATVSQDFDTLLYSTPFLVRNLSITGRRKKAGRLGFDTIKPELISLSDVRNRLGLDSEHMVILGMLVGTDYNYGGIKGIGPVKALKILKECGNDFDALFARVGWEEHFGMPWTDVYYTFRNMPVTDDYCLEWADPDLGMVTEILCDRHDFSRERVENAFSKLSDTRSERSQKGLGEFF